MKKKNLRDIAIYKLFIKNNTPTFTKADNEKGYLFCISIGPCSGCSVKYECHNKIQKPDIAPIVTSKEYEEILKENPEYGI